MKTHWICRTLNLVLDAMLLAALFLGILPNQLVRAYSQTPVSKSQQIKPGDTPDGLSAAEWSSIQEQIASGKYRAYAAGAGGYTSSNPTCGWQIAYGADGVTALNSRQVEGQGWQWGLQLTGFGYTDLQLVRQPTLTANQVTLTYKWDDTLAEWWVNTASGLEQGFTLLERPQGSGLPHGAPLILEMAVTGDLTPVQHGDAIHFQDRRGETILTYDKLHVTDADGKTIPARLSLSHGEKTEVKGDSLQIIVDDRTAAYPLTIDPLLQQTYLKASNTGSGDRFGYAVAVSGDTVVVGAPYEDSNASGVNGNQADNTAQNAGAAYIFTRTLGDWSQQAYLKASNTEAGDQFGYAVAISGDIVVVGAYLEDSNATGVNGGEADNSALDAGAAYVFTGSGGAWSQQAYLKASNTEANDYFGYAVAVSDYTVVVGAYLEDSIATGVNGDQGNNMRKDSGAAYAFTYSGSTWSQQAYLKASNTGVNDWFGCAVAVSGDTVVVGANREDSNATGVNGNQGNNLALDAGAVFVFTRTLGAWSQQAYLKASNTEANDRFGNAVAISGDTVVVGAPYEDSNTTGVNGNQADNSASAAGAAYVFIRSGSAWSQPLYLKASNTEVNDQFGTIVAVSGDTVAVGAYREDSNATGVNGNQADNSRPDSGATYLFVESFCSQQSGAFSNTATWRGGVVPGSSDLACISSGHTVTLDAATAVDSLRVYPGGALDLVTYGFTVENGVTNDGVISQMQTVNSASVEFLHIQNSAATVTHYRGVGIDSSANRQNLGSVSVGVRELNSGEYCTIDGAASPFYTRRCFTIIPESQPAADVRVRLYARTADELNSIGEGSLSVYRFAASWTELTTNRATGNDGGAYSYAEGDTSGFSAFLLGQQVSSPTAISLHSFTAQGTVAPFFAVMLGGLVLACGSLWAWRWRKAS